MSDIVLEQDLRKFSASVKRDDYGANVLQFFIANIPDPAILPR